MTLSRARSFFAGSLVCASLAAIAIFGYVQPKPPASTAVSGATPQVLAMDVFAQGDVVDLLLFEETTRGKELRHQRSQDGAVTWTAQSVIDRGALGIVGHHQRDGSTDSRLWTNGCGAVDDAGHLRLGRGSTCHGHLDRRRPNLARRVQSGRRRFERRPLVSRVGRRREGHLPGLLARRPRRRTRSARRLIARWRCHLDHGTSRSTHAPASAAGTNRLFRVPIPSLSCIGTRAPATWRSQRPSMGAGPGRAAARSGRSTGRSMGAHTSAAESPGPLIRP